jgi:hypothetical protein
MKLFQALFVAGSLALPALLSASSPYDTLSVHVPFEFVAAGQSFPAGDYRIHRADNGLILIQGNGKAAATITVPGSMMKPGDAAGLKFLSDGKREHLVGVQVEGEAVHTLVAPSDQAKRVVLSSR